MGYTKEELKELRKDPNSDLSQVILNDHDTSNRFSTEIHQESVTDPGKVTTNSHSHGETRQESNSEGNTSSVSGRRVAGWRYNADQTPVAEDVQRSIAADEDVLRKAYTLSDAIGANREKIRQQREAERIANEKRAKVASIADSARVIADIISAGAGGNVYAREKDTTAKEMNERNKQLRELQAAEDAQSALLDYQNNRDLALAILQNKKYYTDLASQQFSQGHQDNKAESNQTTDTTSSGTQDQAATTQKSGYVKGSMPGLPNNDKKKDDSKTMPGVNK